jgi:flagellar protein FlgJ
MSSLAQSNAVAVPGLAADQRGLDELRSRSKAAPDKALREAAKQFEALFMNLLMKSMRDALPREDPMASEATRSYTGMLDQQMAQSLAGTGSAGGRGIGLADMLVRQLERSQRPAGGPALHGGMPAAGDALPAGGAPALRAKLESATRQAARPAPGEAAPQSFVQKLQPHAAAMEREFGIPAHFALGQAALETGWGRSEIRAADGSPSHNVFGIKAGRNWGGATVTVTTTEYQNGVAQKVPQRFRAYGSYEEAFRDYAKLISGSPRYVEAIQAQRDAAGYARGIQAGGYATDPMYAAKLTQVINRTLSLQRIG